MDLSVVLLLCFFLLCITQAAEAPCRTLGMRPSVGAALSILLLCANAFHIRPIVELCINPASVLLVLMLFFLCGKSTRALLCALCLSIACAIFTFALLRMQIIPTAQGLWMGALCAACSIALHHNPPTALFCAALSPLLFNLCTVIEELQLFGYTVASIGTDVQFDAQITGILLTGMLIYLIERKKEQVLE